MISIIVPIYNVEDYLEDCLDSILNSSYKDYELILIDDGSTDGSGLICDNYQERDSRITVIHTDNNGISAARNTGLDRAKGDYISFIDGDDIIHPRMLETLKDALESGDYDFSMINYLAIEKTELSTVQLEQDCHLENEFRELKQNEFMNGLIDAANESLKYNFSWNKLYKRTFIGNMRFVNTVIEDMEWNCRVCLKMNKAIYADRQLYYWVQRDSSQVHQGIGERYINRVNSYLLCYKDIPQGDTVFKDRWLERLYKVMLYTHHETKPNRNLNKRSRAICATVYDETKKDLLKSHLGRLKKMVLLSCYRFPAMYSLLRAFS